MTAPEPEYEYAGEWTWKNGQTFVSAEVTLAVAERLVDRHDPREYNPHPTRVLRRPVAEWLPVPQEPGTAKQATK